MSQHTVPSLEEPAGRFSVLLVDDNPVTRVAVDAALSRLELDLVKIGSAKEALRVPNGIPSSPGDA